MRDANVAIVEYLEQRMFLCAAAGVKQIGDTLFIIGDDRPQNVTIYEVMGQSPGTTDQYVSVDFNGNGISDPGDLSRVKFTGVHHFVVSLFGGNDSLTLAGVGGLRNVNMSLWADLGDGDDSFRWVEYDPTDAIVNSNIDIQVRGGDGNDQAMVVYQTVMGGSVVNVDLDMGDGNDSVYTSAEHTITDGSRVSVSADLGRGNDSLTSVLCYDDGFQLLGSDSSLKLRFDGGDGNDSLLMYSKSSSEYPASTQIEGRLDVAMNGGSGDDSMTFSVRQMTLAGGKVAAALDGGSGADNIALTAGVAASSTGGMFSIKALGGQGNDILTTNVNDASGTIAYPSGRLLVDGGPGRNTITTQGNAPYLIRGR